MSQDPQLDALKNRLRKAEKTLKPASPSFSQKPAMQFINAGVDLFAGVLMGAGVGLFVDRVFTISPWGLIVFFCLGAVAGLLNMCRVLTRPPPQHKNHSHE